MQNVSYINVKCNQTVLWFNKGMDKQNGLDFGSSSQWNIIQYLKGMAAKSSEDTEET